MEQVPREAGTAEREAPPSVRIREGGREEGATKKEEETLIRKLQYE